MYMIDAEKPYVSVNARHNCGQNAGLGELLGVFNNKLQRLQHTLKMCDPIQVGGFHSVNN